MTARRRRSTSAKPSGGLTTKAFGGLNKKNYEKKASTFGQRIKFVEGERVTVQFAGAPDDEDAFKEFFQHSWQEGKKWNFVPCTGDDCPLCEEEDSDKAKTSYRFIAKVYDFGTKKMSIMDGPKDLAGRIVYQWERSPSKFLKKVWDVMPLATTPRSYQVDFNDEVRPKLDLSSLDDTKNPVDLDKYLEDSLKAFYGQDGLVLGKSSLDDEEFQEDDDEDEDDAPAPRRRRETARKSTATRTNRKRRARR